MIYFTWFEMRISATISPRRVLLLLFTIGSLVLVPISFAKKTVHLWTAPDSTCVVKNPVELTKTNVSLGKKIYTQQCATCHGSSGKGDGPAAKFLGKHLPDFTDSAMWNQTDGELFWKITGGKAPMPTFKDILAEEQRWQVINYIRTLSPKEQEAHHETR